LRWLRRRGSAGGHLVASLGRAHDFFERHGGKSLLLGRFVAVVRSFVFIAAGAADMQPLQFVIWDVLGAVLWSGIFAFLGYEFGHSLPKLEHVVGAAGLALAGALALGILLALLVRWTWRNQERIWERSAQAWEKTVRSRVQGLAQAHPRAWGWASARLSPAGYLGLHLTLGIAISILALWLFGGVLEDVVGGETLTQLDRVLAARLHALATPGGVEVFRAISWLGSPVTWSVLSAVMLVALLARRRWLLAGGWAAAILGGGVLDLALKLLVHRPRPAFSDAFAVAAGWSFPSGHSMGALVGYGMLAYLALLEVRRGWERVAVMAVAATLIALIGFSRLYLGVHYFSDVVGGYAAGVVWLSACVTGLEVARRRKAFLRAAAAGAAR
ncbi:MAG TPA: phosphatase PAP2 family protein, partial [Longimicrobiales bacterium]